MKQLTKSRPIERVKNQVPLPGLEQKATPRGSPMNDRTDKPGLIEAFAREKRLSTKRDDDGTLIIRGKSGQIFEFDADQHQLGVIVQPDTESARTWNNARTEFQAAGMTITQNGRTEGSATFDPKRPDQVKLAMKYAEVKRKKLATSAQLEALARYRSAKAA